MRYKAMIFLMITAILLVSACNGKTNEYEKDDKISVVASLFVQFDFAKKIVKEKGTVELLLPPGVETHTFEPTPRDLAKIQEANVFVYTGGEMEPWVDKLLPGMTTDALKVVDASVNVKKEEIHDEAHAEEHGDEKVGEDPHIWLNPLNCLVMLDNILAAVCEVDPANAEFYRKNADKYKAEIRQLDEEISEMIARSKKKTLVFGGKFAYGYFLQRYNLAWETAYDGCSTEHEPDVKTVMSIIDFIHKNDISYIYHEEMVEPKVANSIASETGAECLTFSTMHNISREQLDNGVGYIDIMRENMQNIEKGLN